jgi:hypothetical protein
MAPAPERSAGGDRAHLIVPDADGPPGARRLDLYRHRGHFLLPIHYPPPAFLGKTKRSLGLGALPFGSENPRVAGSIPALGTAALGLRSVAALITILRR